MSEDLSIEEIRFGSPDYRTVLGFRDRILRKPLGMTLSPGDTAGEEKQRHFVLRHADTILAGVIAVQVDHQTIRLRQMWVCDAVAGNGNGRALLDGVEKMLKSEGAREIKLNARLSVRGFYEKCGYRIEGEIFDEIGIPHIRMARLIP